MGLFGPSWTWEEIQRKDAIMSELRHENNRVLAELRYMSGDDEILPDIFDVVSVFLVLFLGIGFIFCIPMLFSQLILLDQGDPIAVEVLTWLISAGITYIVSILKIKEKKEHLKNFLFMGITNLIIVMVMMAFVDIVFFGALSTGTKIAQFIFGMIFSLFFMAIWSAIVAGIGMIIVPLIKKTVSHIILRIKLKKRKEIISNSKLYKKIISDISSDLNNIIDIKINPEGLLVNRDSNENYSVIFANESFSNLDAIGVYGLGELIKKEFPNFNLKRYDEGVILNNKDYISKQKSKSKEEKKNKKIKEKNELKKAKELKQEKIKKGEDW